MYLKELEKQIADWSRRMDTEPQKVTAEISIAQFMLIYNIDENISLIRDKIVKKIDSQG